MGPRMREAPRKSAAASITSITTTTTTIVVVVISQETVRCFRANYNDYHCHYYY